MWAYSVRRLAFGIPVILGAIFVVMVILHNGPDPCVQFLGKATTPSKLEQCRIDNGFDQPLIIQYGAYLKKIATLDLGASWQTQEPLVEMIARGAPVSLSLTVPALALTSFLSVCIGLIAAFFRSSRIDRGLMTLAVTGMSISFLVYIVVGQYLLAYVFPLFQIHGFEADWSTRYQYLILPILIFVIVGIGYDSRFYRAVFSEEMSRDHVTTAFSKGAGRLRVMFLHVLKNAMIPIITRIMISLPFLVTGSLLLETFFGIPGLGTLLYAAIETTDHPAILAYTVLISILFVVTTILNDILYAAVDPRVRLS